MKVTLNKKHLKYNYVRKKEVSVFEVDCPKYKCFSPHNWSYRRADGVVVDDFRCNRREYEGCPDIVVTS